MAESLLLINPRRKRRHRAKNARRHHRRRARNPFRAKHRRRSRNPFVTYSKHRRRRHRARNPRHSRRRHRNPFGTGTLVSDLIPAGIGALGAVTLDIAWGYISPMLPTMISSNVYINAAAKGAGAFGLGWLAGMGIGKQNGRRVTIGALTVIVYQLAENLIKQMAPTIPFAGVGAYLPAMGAYLPGPAAMLPNPAAMHGYNPAPYLQGLGDIPGGYQASSDSMF